MSSAAALGDPETGIITALPKEFVRQFWKELDGKIPEEKVKAHQRQAEWAKAMHQQGSTRLDGLGQMAARIDARLFFRLYQEKQEQGIPVDAWLPEYLKDNPHLCAKGYRPKADPARHGLTGGWAAAPKAS